MNTTCLLYASPNLSEEKFKILLSDFLQGTIDKTSFIKGREFTITVLKNDEFNELQQVSFPDGFLFFRFLIEIERGLTEFDLYVRYIDRLITWLWSNHIPTVVSCDFEDLLSEKGGYKSTKIPWPRIETTLN
jgi:hypothetical protein